MHFSTEGQLEDVLTSKDKQHNGQKKSLKEQTTIYKKLKIEQH